MKIAVMLPTRSNPHLLGVVTGAFRHLVSNINDIKFFVRIDADEADRNIYEPFGRINFHYNLDEDVQIILGEAKIPALKAIDIVDHPSFKEFDPDVHVLMSDDVLPLTFQWDLVISAAVEDGHDAFCWQEASDPDNTGYIVLTKKYVKCMPSYLATWFPFWFSDTWRSEVHQMVFNKRMPIITNLKLGGRRGKTNGMQDLNFWFDFFAKTRKDRIKEAEIMAENHGIKFNLDYKLIRKFYLWDEQQLQKCKFYEGRFGGNQSLLHDAAKNRATEHLKNKC